MEPFKSRPSIAIAIALRPLQMRPTERPQLLKCVAADAMVPMLPGNEPVRPERLVSPPVDSDRLALVLLLLLVFLGDVPPALVTAPTMLLSAHLGLRVVGWTKLVANFLLSGLATARPELRGLWAKSFRNARKSLK